MKMGKLFMLINTTSKQYQYSYDEVIKLLQILSDIVYVNYNIDSNGELCDVKFENNWRYLDNSDEVNNHRDLLARFASTGQQHHKYNMISSESAKMLLASNDAYHDDYLRMNGLGCYDNRNY